ncbi:hypothetical protein UQW22_01055 [Isoptericola halotolerans]|uniref:hypothetical protein n=1 Tax=Isoptericola halotolerans TaxID=300560 RepID=UPI00388ECDBD
MTASTTARATDDRRARQELLTGPDAGDVLAAALAADGAALDDWGFREVWSRPGAETTVAYDVVAHRRHDGADRVAREHLYATDATDRDLGRRPQDGAPQRLDGVVRLDGGARTLHVWRHPHDPALPGLAVAAVPAGVGERLAAAGIHDGVRSLETVAYRPLRRAVLRARTGGSTVYVKVVRPRRTDDLVRRHELFEDAAELAAPAVLAAGADGVVVLAELPGPSLAAHLASTPAGRQPDAFDPAELLRVTDALPPAGAAMRRRAPWADRLDRYVTELTDRHDVGRRRLGELATAITSAQRGRDPGPVVTTHGDLHAANLVLADPAVVATCRVAGVLDVDTLGPGHRVDDLACTVAHLAVLPDLAPGTYGGVAGLVDRCLAVLGEAVDPVVLRARAAAVVVSLAAGAPDAALAEAWLGAAGRLLTADERF